MEHRMREIRKSLKLSQEKLAEILGISRVQVTRLETGRRGLSVRNAKRYAEILNEKFELSLDRMDFYLDMTKFGARDETELGLLNKYRGMSEGDRTKFAGMADNFEIKDDPLLDPSNKKRS